jgi:hypothetical protein
MGIEGWQWKRDTQLHEDGYHIRGNGVAPAETRPGLKDWIRLGRLGSVRRWTTKTELHIQGQSEAVLVSTWQ